MVNYTITQYGETKFGLQYSDEELLGVINLFVQKKKEEKADYFTYYTLCKYILILAERENRLIGKESNTYYQQTNLSQKEYTRISRLLWQLILNQKIFVDFSNNAYIAHYENDTVLGIMND